LLNRRDWVRCPEDRTTDHDVVRTGLQGIPGGGDAALVINFGRYRSDTRGHEEKARAKVPPDYLCLFGGGDHPVEACILGLAGEEKEIGRASCRERV
jgi:hypothetical protein